MSKPGTVLRLDELYYNNICGYNNDTDATPWGCSHPDNDEGFCHAFLCPVADEILDKKGLDEIGVGDEYEYDYEGYTDHSNWMEIGPVLTAKMEERDA